MDKLVHPDLHFSFPVFTTKSVSGNPVSDNFIEEWRTSLLDNPYLTLQQWYGNLGVENKQGIINKSEAEAIQRKLSLKSYEADHKVLLMWMPEKMNAVASNKLLKLIEEPPPMTVFLLVSEDTGPILPTVLSRMQLLKLTRLNDKDLLESLKKAYPENEPGLENAVHLAEGNYNNAQEILSMSEESEYNLELFMQIMRLAYSRKWQEMFEWVDEVSALGRERQKSFLLYSLRMVRENYLLNLQQDGLVKLNPKESEFSGRFSRFIGNENAPSIIEELEKASVHIEANAYPRIVFLDFALKLVKRIR
jgi:DNA polymerase-3 subunit delta'